MSEERKKLLEELKLAGLLSQYKKDSELWKQAFSLFNNAHEVRDRVGMCCVDNFKRVAKWLEQ